MGLLRTRLVLPLLLAAAALALLLASATPRARAAGEFNGSLPPAGGVALLVAAVDVNAPALLGSLNLQGCDASSIWVTAAGGFVGYVNGAPEFVNASFPPILVSGSPFVAVCRAHWTHRDIKWPAESLPVALCYNPAGEPGNVSGVPAMIEQAMALWEAGGAGFDFEYAGLCDHSASNHDDGVNAIGWASLVGPAGTTTTKSIGDRIIETDVELTTSKNIAASLFVILAHELGHVLGLGHPETGCVLMSPDACSGSITQHDVAGALDLYP